LRARAVRALVRFTTRRRVARALRSPDFPRRYRAILDQMKLSFGRLPRGVRSIAVDEPDAAVRGEWIVPVAGAASSRVVYYLHGGGFAAGSPAHYRSLTGALARACHARVFVPDYRLAPEAPFPAAIDDALAGYDWLLGQRIAAKDVVAAGDSAGGGLTLSFLLAARDSRRSMPAAGVLLSPWTDLASTGESVRTNARIDDVIVRDDANTLAHLYARDLPLDDPRISGLYADLAGLPPLLIQASEIEMLRDDAVRVAEKARAAGVDATLQLFDGVQHVWQLFTWLPESREAIAGIASFVMRVTSR
jgi:monoterpene epsilon-lactone hydrolase